MNQDVNFLDKKIRKYFKLFQNPTNSAKDKRTYTEIYEKLVKEMYLFIQENLDVSRTGFLLKEVKKIKSGTDAEEKKQELLFHTLFKYAAAIPDFRYRLQKRLEYVIEYTYLDQLKSQVKAV